MIFLQKGYDLNRRIYPVLKNISHTNLVNKFGLFECPSRERQCLEPHHSKLTTGTWTVMFRIPVHNN